MISIIVAVDMDYAIGYENKLLCRLKDDMEHFVGTTTGKPIIMGRKTFESLGCKPLKDRFNIVLTNSPMAMTIDHIDVLHDYTNVVFENLEMIELMMEQSPEKEFVVIGGQQIYELFLPYASKIYFTRIHHNFEKADAYFPRIDIREWEINSLEHFPQNERNQYSFNLYTLERK